MIRFLAGSAGLALLFVATPIWAQSGTKAPKPLAVGDKAVDFTIASLGDKQVKLSERFGEKGRPVVLAFSRAHW